MDKLLNGKVAIVTGAGAGIGKGVALALASEGARVVVAGRTLEPLEETVRAVRERGGDGFAVSCDVRVPTDLDRLVGATVDRFGRLDILVNNAQTYRHAPLLDATEDDLQSTFASGPFAAFHAMKLAYPHLKSTQGVVVNFGSGCQIDANESFHSVYTAAKNAIEGFTRVAANEWGPDGIRTFLIMPAARSPQSEAFKARDPEKYARMMANVPLGRFGDPETDIGQAIAWLVSDRNRFMTGATIMLDGGQMYLR